MIYLFFYSISTRPESQRILPAPPHFLDYPYPVYSGYLDASHPSRKLFYVFLESQAGPDRPLVVWMNGGPGCSSLFGLFAEHGPFLTPNNFTQEMRLMRNNFSWNKHANMLYVQSPGAVGWSIAPDDLIYNDTLVTADNLAALKHFLLKFPDLSKNKLFLSGESYAGKYIPDLARQLLSQERDYQLEGIIIGNGVFNYENHEKQRSSMDYLVEHNFIEFSQKEAYQESCRLDFQSPRCLYFRAWFLELRSNFDIYNFFEVCYNRTQERLSSIPQCYLQFGIEQYMNMFPLIYHSKSPRTWNVCNNLTYNIDQKGSLASYRAILGKIRILTFVGDFDSQASLVDTIKNLDHVLKLTPKGNYKPWFYDNQHAGFTQLYEQKLQLVTVKGAGHMASKNKRAECSWMLKEFLEGRWV